MNPSAGSEFSHSFPQSWKSTAGDEQIAIEPDMPALTARRAHHLGRVLDQPAAPCVVIAARRRSPPKPGAVVREKEPRQPAQPQIADRLDALLDELEIRRLFLPQSRRPREQRVALRVGELAAIPTLRIEPVVAAVRELARHFQKGAGRQPFAKRKSRRITPRAECELRLRVASVSLKHVARPSLPAPDLPHGSAARPASARFR